MINEKDYETLPMKAKTPNARRVNLKSLILIVLIAVGLGTIFLLQSKNSSLFPSGDLRPGKGVPARFGFFEI